jgi:hypothetical protein
MTRRTPVLIVVVVALMACAATAHAQTTALYVESDANDPLGSGRSTYLSGLSGNVRFTTQFFPDTLEVEVEGPETFWVLDVRPKSGGTLAVGSYAFASSHFSGTAPGIAVGHDGFYCDGGDAPVSWGRFVIRELVTASDTVTRLAVDFEYHCRGADAGLYGALRFNSTVSSIAPFDGGYPDYRLAIAPPQHGRVTGAGINCTAGGGTCSRTFVGPASEMLGAVPDPGYAFIGWEGACDGITTATVRVFMPTSCAAVFDSVATPSARTSVYFAIQPPDASSPWQEIFVDQTDGVIALLKETGFALSTTADAPENTYWLDLDPGEAWVAPADYYAGPKGYSGVPPRINSSVAYPVCGDSVQSGRFSVLDVAYAGDGSVSRLAVDFEVHCRDLDRAVYGSLRYASTIPPIPFGGAFPMYRLTVVPAAHGTVTGPGIACGPEQSACSAAFTAPTTVTLTPVADPGYLFVGWRGSCSELGGISVALRVHGVRQCQAAFDTVTPAAPRSLVFLDSQPADPVGLGQRYLYGGDTNVYAERFLTSNGINVWAGGWLITLQTGAATVAPGSYSIPVSTGVGGTHPAISAGVDNIVPARFCANQQASGRFVVYDVAFDDSGNVTRFAADFEQHCGGADPALVGSIRFHSLVAGVVPFGGAYPDNRLTIDRMPHGLVTGGGISCGHAQVSCTTALAAPADVALTALPDAGYTFAGWIGACAGGASVSVHVNQPLTCRPLFIGPATATGNDLDGDQIDDLALWRGSAGLFLWGDSSQGSSDTFAKQWGSAAAGDVPFLADLDGDGKADFVVWRATTGTWYWLTSSTGYNYAGGGGVQWGAAGDVPLLGDFDGDGKADLAVWRASTGTWYWLLSSSGFSYAAARSVQWGSAASGDVPRLADFDGDGKADLVVWRASTGTWYWLTSSTNYAYGSAGSVQWGNAALGDTPLVGDVDGDGRADLLVWRASTGTWYWLTSTSSYAYGAARTAQWGNAAFGDVPLLKDFDGDGVLDLTVWRASTGTWYWLTSSSGFTSGGSRQWGAAGDVPIGR